MSYTGGTSSALWQLMKDNHVDLYLCGEVHDITAHTVDGMTQISHGGLIQRANANYLLGDISADSETITLTSKQFIGATADWTTKPQLWQTDTSKLKARTVNYPDVPTVVGTMVLGKDNTVISQDGILAPYAP